MCHDEHSANKAGHRRATLYLQGGPASAAQTQQQPRKKQRKSSSPDALLMAEVRQAAKHNDPLAGLAAYDKARHAGKPRSTCTCCAAFYMAWYAKVQHLLRG